MKNKKLQNQIILILSIVIFVGSFIRVGNFNNDWIYVFMYFASILMMATGMRAVTENLINKKSIEIESKHHINIDDDKRESSKTKAMVKANSVMQYVIAILIILPAIFGEKITAFGPFVIVAIIAQGFLTAEIYGKYVIKER